MVLDKYYLFGGKQNTQRSHNSPFHFASITHNIYIETAVKLDLGKCTTFTRPANHPVLGGGQFRFGTRKCPAILYECRPKIVQNLYAKSKCGIRFVSSYCQCIAQLMCCCLQASACDLFTRHRVVRCHSSVT